MHRSTLHSALLSALLWATLAAFFISPQPLAAQSSCPEEPALLSHPGTGAVGCPCFVAGEEAGVVFQAPAAHYPLEIMRVALDWQSQFGSAPQSLQQAVHIYAGGLPNPGAPVTSIPGPLLNDGFTNEFNVEPFPGKIIIPSGPFMVTVEFATTNAGDIFAPSVVHDGAGCIPGKNVVFAIPGGWNDACLLGVTGNWKFHVVYRPVNCGTTAASFVRGDCNVDGFFNIADAVIALGFLFNGGSVLCHVACDSNDDGVVNIADPVFVLASLFGGGPAPSAPHPTCGPDPTPDALTCGSFGLCP